MDCSRCCTPHLFELIIEIGYARAEHQWLAKTSGHKALHIDNMQCLASRFRPYNRLARQRPLIAVNTGHGYIYVTMHVTCTAAAAACPPPQVVCPSWPCSVSGQLKPRLSPHCQHAMPGSPLQAIVQLKVGRAASYYCCQHWHTSM
jgi:hypothetical protein